MSNGLQKTIKADAPGHALEIKKALAVSIANDLSIAYGCAKAFRLVGDNRWVNW